ncbi:MAG: T9SS type A sorting domain-containing protein [Calditrichaeota bacterium]|nr:T9SS type A sorting domain-containing protein [Calditrichota bacterium]
MQKNAIVILILAILLAFSATGFSQASYDTLSIYDLQYVPDPVANDLSPYLGDTVVVKGMVMNNPRDLWIGARWSAYIIDQDSFPNPWSGFFVVQNDTFQPGTLFGFVEPGTICYFTGVVSEFSNFSQITLLDNNPLIPVEILSVGNPLPDPVLLTADDIDDRADAEQWESMWVKVEDATILNNAVSGNWASFTDASGGTAFMGEYFNWFRDRLNAGTYTWPPNGTSINVQGFTRDETAGYSINPRDTLDVVLLSDPPPVIANVSRNPGAPGSSDVVTVSANIEDNISVASARINYSVDWNAFQEVAMSAGIGGFTGDIPAQGDGAFVRYYISATDNVGGTSVFPGDTSMTSGGVYFYVVRDGNHSIRDIQYTWGYANDASGFNGYEVTVEGVVMTDSTDYVGDYWIQEARAPWSGIWVNDADHVFLKGDWVSVTGVVEENFNVTRINGTAASLVQAGFGEYEPIDQTTGNITTGADSAEAYESVLVKVSNVTVTNPFPDPSGNFGEFVIDDGSGELRVDDLFSAFRGNLDSAFVSGDKYSFITAFHYYSFGNYKLAPRDSLDIGPLTGIEDNITAPLSYSLSQNYPNPFNPSTTIRYTLAQSGKFKLEVFNVLGQRVATLANQFQTAGAHQVTWDGRNDAGNSVGSGIYFYQLSGNNTTLTQKMILLK